jgi:hypothetical protein
MFARHPQAGSRRQRICSADQPPAAPAPPDQVQPSPPPLTPAEGHGLYAVRAALTPPKPAGRMPTRDEARRLLDHLEGRAFEALGPEHPNTNRVRDNLARSLSAMGHADGALAHSQAAEASPKKVLGPDHYGSKDSAGLSTRGQCVVDGNKGPPRPPLKLSTTTKEVGNETKGVRILAHSKLEKAQQPSLDPTPNPPLAKAEATEIQRKFEEVWTLYAKRGKSEAQALSASSSSRARAACAAPWRPTPGILGDELRHQDLGRARKRPWACQHARRPTFRQHRRPPEIGIYSAD